MLLTLLGAIIFAVAVCGAVAGIFRLLRIKLPRGVIPLLGGVAMFGFAAWNENSWYTRQLADLPDTITVVRTGEFSNFIQPWTVLFPRINRYLAVDSRNIVVLGSDPAIRRVEIINAERYTPTRVVTQLVDCAQNRGVLIPPTGDAEQIAAASDTSWFAIEPDDPLIAAVCG